MGIWRSREFLASARPERHKYRETRDLVLLGFSIVTPTKRLATLSEGVWGFSSHVRTHAPATRCLSGLIVSGSEGASGGSQICSMIVYIYG